MKLIIGILILNSISSCQIGCLKCNSNNKCEICDITNQYFLEDEQCLQNKMDNCIIQNPKGTCIVCNQTTLLDPNTNKCIKQNQDSEKDNCLYLSESQQCLRCAQNFVIIEGKCEAVSTKIQNCLEYKNKTECQKCESNYYLSSITKTCSQLPSQRECIIYTEYQCQQCKSNFIHDENSLYQTLQNNQTKLIQTIIDTTLDKMTINNNFQICYEKTIDNCLEYSDTKTCFSCQSGYYLENNLCYLYPSASIANCQIYLTENKCKNCKTNYYLTDDNNCRVIPQESKDQNLNCEIFKSDITDIECKICKENFYINSNGICTERTATVENCELYLADGDKCQICKDNFILSTEGLKCTSKLDNCSQHTTFNKDSSPECSKCDDQYYLDTSCKKGTISNCLIYENETQCTQCENKFYLTNDKKCLAHDLISECKEYSQQIKNKCQQCNDLFRSFRIKSKCKNLPIIQHCRSYNNQNTDTQSTCSQCDDEYKLNDNKCIKITVANCLQENSETNQCNKCKQGFYLATFEDPNINHNICVEGYQYIHNQCSEVNLLKSNLNDNSQCNICKKQSYPYKINPNQSVCIKDELMPNLDINNVNLITNCLTYRGIKCIKCAKDFYLKQDQTQCLSNKCQGNTETKSIYHSFYIQNQNDIDYYLPNYCNQPNLLVNNNWVLAPSIKDKVQIALKCKTNFQIVNLNIGDVIDYSNFNPDTLDSSKQINDMLDIYPKIQCPNFSSGLNINGQVRTSYPTDLQCQYFVKKNEEYLCVSCPFGQTGSSNSENHLDSCIAITGCSNTKLYNIHPFWSQFMTCHQCTETSKIPVIAWQGVSKSDPTFQSFKKFTLSEENWTSPNGDNPMYSQPIFCLDYTSIATIKAGLNLSVDNSKIDKVNNCGYALLNLAYSNSFDSSGSTAQPINETDALICGGCKPGYKGTYIDEFYVINCEVIQNCKNGSKWFNACSECSDDYVHLFNNGKVDYQTCVKVPSKLKNCIAFEQTINTLSTVGKCRICKKGYNLNQDGYCELLNSVNCNTDNFINLNSIFNDNNNLNEIFYYFYEQGLGCQQCKDNYFAYQTDGLDNQICLQSDFITEELTFESNSTNNISTVFVNNCEKYSNSNPNFTTDKFYTCSQCVDDYILRSDGSACIENIDKKNCIKLDVTTDNCVKCKDGFGLEVKDSINKCVEGKIENCLIYNTSSASETVQCNKCEDGYYIEENLCKKSQFTNCKKASGKFSCQACQDDYWPVGETDEDGDIIKIHYCLKKDDNLKCDSPQITLTNEVTEFSCTYCQDPQGVIESIPESNNQLETDNLLTQCLSMNEIENCTTHISKVMPTFEQQIHECEQCESDYFVSQSGLYCQQRANKDSKCKEYQLQQDSCKICSEGYFIEEQGVKCIPNPAGVVGCKKYKKGPVCTQCITNRFLEDNECREINDDNKILNCLYYSSNTECSQCQDKYYLTNNKCEKSDLSNCEVLESLDSCKICNDGFVFEVNDSKNTCKEFTRTKCEILDLNSPYECLICSDNYYVDNKGECIKVSDNDQIENCLKYKSSTECSKCSSEFVLTPDNKKCINKESYDSNCQVQILRSTLQCALCPAGSLIKGQSCESQQDQMNDQNCLIIDKTNPKKCYICKPQNYMNQNGQCIQSTKQNDDETQDEVQQVIQDNIQIILASLTLFVFYFQIIQFQLKFQSCR